jgi:hypothetical protein
VPDDPRWNNSHHTGLFAVTLVRQYVKVFPILRPVVVVLKAILFVKGLHNTYTGGLSSYCLTLMVVTFLYARWQGRWQANRARSGIEPRSPMALAPSPRHAVRMGTEPVPWAGVTDAEAHQVFPPFSPISDDMHVPSPSGATTSASTPSAGSVRSGNRPRAFSFEPPRLQQPPEDMQPPHDTGLANVLLNALDWFTKIDFRVTSIVPPPHWALGLQPFEPTEGALARDPSVRNASAFAQPPEGKTWLEAICSVK